MTTLCDDLVKIILAVVSRDWTKFNMNNRGEEHHTTQLRSDVAMRLCEIDLSFAPLNKQYQILLVLSSIW